MFRKTKKASPETHPGTEHWAPSEYGALFTGARRKERMARLLQTAGEVIREAYENTDSTRRPTERGNPAVFSIAHASAGRKIITPRTIGEVEKPFVTITKTVHDLYAPYMPPRLEGMHKPSLAYDIVPGYPEYIAEFHGLQTTNNRVRVTFGAEDNEFKGMSRVGDSDTEYMLTRGNAKSIAGNELLGGLYELCDAELSSRIPG